MKQVKARVRWWKFKEGIILHRVQAEMRCALVGREELPDDEVSQIVKEGFGVSLGREQGDLVME